MEYLPKLATIEQACKWLEAKTGEKWILARLLEFHLTPYFWIDYKVGYPQLFGNRVEGYLTKMIFNGDIVRLEADGTDALVNMFTAHDDAIIPIEPGWRVPLTELRFKREDVEGVAEIIKAEKEPSQSKSEKPVPRFQAQEAAILNAIKEAGYAPEELPENEAGKSGVKFKVRDSLKGNPLFVGSTVFDKAWERLQNTKEIRTVPRKVSP